MQINTYFRITDTDALSAPKGAKRTYEIMNPPS